MTRRLVAAASVIAAALLALPLLASPASAAAAAAPTTPFRPIAVAADGAPVAWPCAAQAVRLYRPPTARHAEVIRTALTELGKIAGVTFTVTGESKVSPWKATASDPAIIVGFDKIDPKYAGWAKHVRTGTTWTQGRVTLNTAVGYVAAPVTESDWAHYENTVLHELGHLVGLDHVDARAEAMFGGWNTGRTTYGRGDRAGLVAVGCRKLPRPAATGATVYGDGMLAATGPR